MKCKFTFLLVAILLLTTGLTWGQTRNEVVAYTLDGTVTGGSNGYATESEIEQGGITWMVTGNTTMSPWRIGGKSITDTDRPLYSTSSLTDNITKVVVTHGTASGITVNSMTLIVSANSNFSSPTSTLSGTFVENGTTTFERPTGADWSGKYFKIVYNVTVSVNSNKFLQFTSAEFYKEESGSGTQTVATPTFSPAAGTYNAAQNVTISTTTAGATIYYTTDGTEPIAATGGPQGTVYSSPIAISQTTTVKAVAVKNGMNNSAVASATYTIQQLTSLSTIPAIWDFASSISSPTQASITFNNWYVTAVKGSNAYVSDGQYGFIIYQSSHGFNVGDKLSGTFTCNVTTYQGAAELTGVKASNLTVTSGQTVPELSATIGDLVAMNYSTIVNLGTLTYDGSVFTDGNNTITPYNTLNISPNPLSSLESGKQYTVKGMFLVYNQTKEIAPRSADDFEEVTAPTQTVATPTFSPAAGTYNSAQNVTISCATADATIYYTLDGTEPIAATGGPQGDVYSSPIAISQTTTVKAVAVKTGMNNSAVASATYTIQAGPTLITIAEAKALQNNAYALVQGVVTFIDGRNVYVQDSTAGIDLFLNSNTVPQGLALGDKVQAYGQKTVYNGLIELKNINGGVSDQFSILSTGNTLPVAEKTIAEILSDFQSGANLLQSTRVQIVEATVDTINTANNTQITQGQSSLNIYKMPVVEGLVAGDVITVTGVIGCYNNPQLRVASADDVTVHQQPVYLAFHKLQEHTDVEANGTYMIVDVNGGFALTSANLSSAAPTAVPVTIEGDSIYGVIDNALQWNITAVDSGYMIKPIDTLFYLYTTAANNGVRVGTNENNVWEFDITDGANYHGFRNVATNRYLGVYNNSDWRAYTSINNNIKNTDIEIFVLGTAPVHTYYAVNVAQVTNGTVTVSATQAEEGDVITVTAEPNTNYQLTSLTYSYTGAAPIDIMQTMQFTMPASDVTITAVFTILDAVAAPTFNPIAGSYIQAQEVSLACATADATIYYTLDGTDPTPNSSVYTDAITISQTTTVKAMAAKAGMIDSEIATAEYTIIEPMTIAAAKALNANEYALVQGVVTFIDGRNIYVQDATAGIDLFLNNNTVPANLAVGDEVLGYGKKAVYNGLIELSGINGGNANQFVVLSNGNTLPEAQVKTIAEVLADYAGDNLLQSTRVQIVEATIGTINTNGNTPITQGENTLNLYKMPVVDGLLANDIVTVTGVVGCYNTPQLRINSADEVTFVHPPVLTVNPTSLAGINYTEGQGPSDPKMFNLSASNLVGAAYVYPSANYQISSVGGDLFAPESCISISGAANFNNLHIYVRLKAGLELGDYDEVISAWSEGADTVYVPVSGSVMEPQVASDYVRLTELSQLNNGAKVIFAARFDENANDYYAMTAQASGKPTGVLFTSITETAETLPNSIADADSLYYWTVTTDGTNYTFTTAGGDVLGYTSSTNFATGGDNTAWTITAGTSEAGAMVPEYTGFVITNGNVTNRAFALNSNHNFGPYHTQNLNGSGYNFFLDMFVIAGTGTMVCATPTFSPAAGTYYESQEITINCVTADATIYYTLDGSDPTPNSMVYTEPFVLSENTTVKAIAVKEGYEDSEIAEAEYVFILDAVTIFNQDWEGDMNGWTFVTVEGSKPWVIGQYQGNHYANANGYNGGVNEQWCISPAFSLEQYSDVTLSFLNAKNYNGPDVQLFFSNDYDGSDPTAANWTELTFEKSTGSFTWVESGIIEFTGFAGDECYIGFKYTSTETEAAAWEIDDIVMMGFTSDPVLNVTPLTLTFTYIEGNGPSNEQTISITGFNLTENVLLSIDSDEFEMSDASGEDFDPMDEYEIEVYEGAVDEVIYVRLAEGLAEGTYTATITIESELDDITVELNGTVNEPIQSGDWNRIGSLADLHNGDQVVIASRYDATVGDGYYAMPAEVSGKPDGVLFTSVINDGVETLPDEIVADITTFVWNVTVSDTVITLTNAEGAMLGYSSSTNFAGDTNTDWSITFGTAGENAMVPNYSGFVITNVNTPNRGIAQNASHKFGAYSTSNINNGDYNFYQDLFVLGGSATQTVATPVFSMNSGTYYEEIDVEITCATEGATIYYTNDGTEPTAASTVYEGAIHVAADVTLKAIAMMEGYENSGVATANYVIITGLNIILQQDWEGEMNGWTFVTVEGNKPWNVSSYGGNHYAYANGYNDDVDNEQWCISPAFDLTNMTDVVLTFRNAKNYTGPDLELYFSSDYDGQDPTAASWHELQFEMSTGGYTWTESGEISLDGLRSDNCYIGFRYISTIDDGAAAWEVDDILITGTAYDAVEETELSNVGIWNHNDELYIENNTNGNLQMVVFNLLGQPVYTQTIGAGSVRFSHNLAKGVYVVTLQNSKERMAVKMIVR